MSMRTVNGTRRLVFLSLFAAFGLVMFVFESFLPVLPWFRPGLGNSATLLALMLLGFGDSVKVTVLRIVLGALILGRLFTPLFLFAFAGGLASVLVMAAAARLSGRLFSPVGISVLGAVAHNLVQLGVAYFFVNNAEMFIFIPIFVATGVVSGALVGVVSRLVYERLAPRFGAPLSWPGRIS